MPPSMNKPFRIPLFAANVALLALLVVIGLWVIYSLHFRTASTYEFLEIVAEFITTAAGAVVWVSGGIWLVMLTVNLLRRKDAPARLTREQLMEGVYPVFVERVLRPVADALLTAVVLGTAAVLLVLLPFIESSPFFPPGGRIVATPALPDVRDAPQARHIYAVAPKASAVFVFDENAAQLSQETIPLGTHLSPSHPRCVAIAPRAGKILVADSAAGKLYIIDRSRNVETVAVGQQPRCVAVTPDERKAYISNEQPAPHGTISVYDFAKRALVKTIKGVNCPEGIAVTRDGRRLYAASQCGAGQDPLFVIDTSSDEVVATVRGFAVGLGVAVSPDDKHVLVWRHNPNPSSGDPNLLSVISRSNHSRVTEIGFEDPVEAVAFTSDGRFLFVATGANIKVYDAATFTRTNEIAIRPRPIGVAVSDLGALYALREDGSVFFTGLAGLIELKKP